MHRSRVARAVCQIGGPYSSSLVAATSAISPKIHFSLSSSPMTQATTTLWQTPTNALPQVRRYRGEANDSPAVLSQDEQVLLDKARPRAKEILRQHFAPPSLDKIPATSWSSSSEAAATEDAALEIRRKRLLYRSKQRGWLEVDLLLGTWAQEHLWTLEGHALDQYEAFVNQETIDIYNIITLRIQEQDMPEELRGNEVVRSIQVWARSSPLRDTKQETC